MRAKPGFPCAVLSGVALLLAVPGFAQTNPTPAQPPKPTIVYASPIAGFSCPAALEVQRGSGAGLVAVDHSAIDQQPKGPAQQLHLTTTNDRIVNMQILARGFSAGSRVLPLAPVQKQPSLLTKTVGVSFSGDPWGARSTDIWLENFSTVSSVDVLAVTFNDGSTWHASTDRECQVTPDPLMLIGSAAKQ